MLALVLLAAALATPIPAPAPTPSPSPQRMLGLIRAQFRSHRPPPPYETYTLVRAQKALNGYPDPVNSYTEHVWLRNIDGAALKRLVYRDDARGPLTFDRPAFNEDRDPGPPTADVFEPAPARPHPVSEPRTPEPSFSALPVIGSVRGVVESDYRVDALTTEGGLVHLKVFPIRDVARNRLRDIYADATSLELRRLTAVDTYYVNGGKFGTFPITYTLTMGSAQGIPVVTTLHGVVGGGYDGEGKEVDFRFSDVAFPAALPAWYFDRNAYAAHQHDAPL